MSLCKNETCSPNRIAFLVSLPLALFSESQSPDVEFSKLRYLRKIFKVCFQKGLFLWVVDIFALPDHHEKGWASPQPAAPGISSLDGISLLHVRSGPWIESNPAVSDSGAAWGLC